MALSFYERIAEALESLSQKYLFSEDPEERRNRLREEALAEIDATVLPILQMRVAAHGLERA
jgi:hypothetical protein